MYHWLVDPRAWSEKILAQRRRLRRIVTSAPRIETENPTWAPLQPNLKSNKKNALKEPLKRGKVGELKRGKVLSCCLPKCSKSKNSFFSENLPNCCFLTRSSLNLSNNRASSCRTSLPKWFHLFWKKWFYLYKVKRWFWAFFAPKQEIMKNRESVKLSVYKKM